MKQLDTRGPEIGICNICGILSRLTEDHIPPKGVPLVGQVYLSRLTETLGVEKLRRSERFFQRGVKYRSICANCNNVLLGSKYDPTLIQFCKELHSTLARTVFLPISRPVKINRLLRAFVAHLISHGIEQHRVGTLSSDLTDYLLNDSAAFPANLRAYLWLYPYKPQIVAHGLGRISKFGAPDNISVFSLLKFYPIGFLCSISDLPHDELAQVTRVDSLSSTSIDHLVSVELNISFIPHGRWPELPGKYGAVFHNEHGTATRPVQT